MIFLIYCPLCKFTKKKTKISFKNKHNRHYKIDIRYIKNLNSFKKDIKIKNNNKIIKKLIDAKKVRKKIILLKQDINKPDFGRN